MGSIEGLKCNVSQAKQLLTLEKVHEMFKVMVLYQLKRLVKKKLDLNLKKKEFVNHVSALEIVKVSNEHIQLITFAEFMT